MNPMDRLITLVRSPAACVAGLMFLFAPVTHAQAPSGSTKKIGDWRMWGGSPDRNMVSDETNMPDDWELKSGKNVKWVAELGSQSYGNPVIYKGRILVGTNNEGGRNPKVKGDKGVVMCFNEADGSFLWQATHDKLESGRVNDWPLQGICSSPVVEDGRAYYVSNRCELVCVDMEGFYDDENDGPVTDEKLNDKIDADIVWRLDMIRELGVFPHNLATCSPVMLGDTVFVITSNGVDEGHVDLPAPNAPSFLAVDKKSGKVLWHRKDPGRGILHGQWSAPAIATVDGRAQVIFPGGDGWLRAFTPDKGEPIWQFDCNPKDAKYILGGRGTRNEIIATPVVYDNKVYVAVGQDPEHGEGIGHQYAIDITKTGDVTESGKVWHFGNKDFGRTIATNSVKDDLCYAVDLGGYFNCLDAQTGKLYWKHDLMSAVWGSPYTVDGKVYIGDEDGDVAIFKHGRTAELIREINMGDSVYTTPVASNGVLYIVTRSKLYALVNGKMPS